MIIEIDTGDYAGSLNRDRWGELEEIVHDVVLEYLGATDRFPDFRSNHEGLAIVEEEFEEFKSAAFWPHKSDGFVHEEARQLAAMAIRFLMDVVYDKRQQT